MVVKLVPLFLLLLPSLAGCLEGEPDAENNFIVHVANRTSMELYRSFAHNGNGAGGGWIPAGDTSHTTFTCLTENPHMDIDGRHWRFKLTMLQGPGGPTGDLFAEKEERVTCGHYTFWVHPDGYILFEEGRTTDGPAPWER